MHIGNYVGLLGLGILAGCASHPTETASQLPATATSQELKVTSPDFKAGEEIPSQFSSYAQNKTPTIKWSGAPAGTKSLVLLTEDPDAPGSKPFVHWLITDIPPTASSEPGSGTVGKNQNGENAYYGPHPPAGKPHRYQFQIFALDLPSLKSTDRDGVEEEMKGHVLAKGVLEAQFRDQ